MDNLFRLLGTSAGPGVPSFFCGCRGCLEAQHNPALVRTRSGGALITPEGTLLIDASPDLRSQLLREGIEHLEGVFLTHWHFDHYAGLGELEYYVKLLRHEPLTLVLPPSAEPLFAQAFPHLHDCFVCLPWTFGETYHFGRLRITPLAANHGIETAGFLVESTTRKLAYFPDTAGLPAVTGQLINEVDWLICDATFHDDNWLPNSHMSMEQAIELGKSVNARHTVLTHLAIHYSSPTTTAELHNKIAGRTQVSIAHDGMTFRL